MDLAQEIISYKTLFRLNIVPKLVIKYQLGEIFVILTILTNASNSLLLQDQLIIIMSIPICVILRNLIRMKASHSQSR